MPRLAPPLPPVVSEKPSRKTKPGAARRRAFSDCQYRPCMCVSSASGGLLVLLVVVVDLGELRVDHVLLGAGARGARGRLALRLRTLGLPIHGLAELHRGLRQRVGLG